MKKKTVFIILAMLLINSCGFSLRGQVPIPEELANSKIIATNDVSSDLKLRMQRELNLLPESEESKPSQANLSETAKNQLSINGKDFTILLQKETNEEQVTSISSSTTPRQYLLHQRLMFSVKLGDEFIINKQTVTSTRQFTSNSDNILGSNYEGELLQKEMHRDLVKQIIMRVVKAQGH